MVVEEHGAGQQLVRFRLRPHLPAAALALLVGSGLAVPFSRLAGLVAAGVALLICREISAAVALGRQAVRASGGTLLDASRQRRA
jgi:hypothetical protein